MDCHKHSLYRRSVWTLKICPLLKSIILGCVTCRRVKGKTLSYPRPPPLPKERVTWKCLFAGVGVDHTGHIYYRDIYGQQKKLYACLFVCTTDRGVHLEVVDNLSTDSFILCLRRLSAAKGTPSVILSDNHCTFVSGEKFLLYLKEDPIVQEHLAGHNVVWKHQTPCSPWMGMHFERLV